MLQEPHMYLSSYHQLMSLLLLQIPEKKGNILEKASNKLHGMFWHYFNLRNLLMGPSIYPPSSICQPCNYRG